MENIETENKQEEKLDELLELIKKARNSEITFDDFHDSVHDLFRNGGLGNRSSFELNQYYEDCGCDISSDIKEDLHKNRVEMLNYLKQFSIEDSTEEDKFIYKNEYEFFARREIKYLEKNRDWQAVWEHLETLEGLDRLSKKEKELLEKFVDKIYSLNDIGTKICNKIKEEFEPSRKPKRKLK